MYSNYCEALDTIRVGFLYIGQKCTRHVYSLCAMQSSRLRITITWGVEQSMEVKDNSAAKGLQSGGVDDIPGHIQGELTDM